MSSDSVGSRRTSWLNTSDGSTSASGVFTARYNAAFCGTDTGGSANMPNNTSMPADASIAQKIRTRTMTTPRRMARS